MDDNRIEIVAGLDIPKTKSTIKGELEGEVKPYLDKTRALKIICHIDKDSITSLQNELNILTKGLKLDIGGININTSGAVSEASKIVSDIQKVVGAESNLRLQVDSAPINAFVERLKDMEVGEKIIDQLTKRLESLDVVITKIVPQFTQLKGGEQQLTSVSISGLDKAGNAISYIEKFNAENGDFERATTKMVSNLAKVEKENKKVEDSAKSMQLAYNDFLKLQGTFDVYSKKYGDNEGLKYQFEDISKLISEFDNTAPVEKQRESIIKIDNALKLVKVDIDAISKATKNVKVETDSIYPSIAFNKGDSTSALLENAKGTLNDFFRAEDIDSAASRIKRAVEDTSGGLQRFYVQVERGDKSVETLTYALNEQGDAYEYLGKVIREADNSTDFRHKDLETQWAEQAEKLKQFAINADKAGLASGVLAEDIKRLFELLNAANPQFGGDTNAMHAFLDALDLGKAKMQTFNAEARKDNYLNNLDRRIQKLTSDVRTYAETNERAVKSTKLMTNGVSFADAWRGIEQLAQKAQLSDQEIKQLATDMSIFRSEAKAAGLAGESAFGKFLNSFKLMSSYITANMVFNFVKRQIRDMVNEVTALDTAMVELRKVTEATEEDFRKFQKSAGNTAKELGASITDVINATSTFARLGESLPDAEELGKVAILYQNVGDGITETQAAEDLVSTMKAFNIEAQNSIEIVDKFNEVGNNFAISSGGIGEALKRSASALAAGNNTLSESIALITTAKMYWLIVQKCA